MKKLLIFSIVCIGFLSACASSSVNKGDTSNCNKESKGACVNGACLPTLDHGKCVCDDCYLGPKCDRFDVLNCS